MTGAERVRAELEVLGLDASRHVLDFYAPLLQALQITRTRTVQDHKHDEELLIAGVKVATQTPPIRTGRRVVFLTLDDSTGPLDATFFEDVQGPYAATIFHSWLLVVRGVLRRTGPRGISVRATGAWELPELWEVWTRSGLAGVQAVLNADAPDRPDRRPRQRTGDQTSVPAEPGAIAPTRVVGAGRDDGALSNTTEDHDGEDATGLPAGDRTAGTRPPAGNDRSSDRAGGMGGGRRRVLVHPTGYQQSPYADLKPPGQDTRQTRQMLPPNQQTSSQTVSQGTVGRRRERCGTRAQEAQVPEPGQVLEWSSLV